MILLDHVTKTYSGDAEPALDSVSLHIEPHEFVFLVGKSGAGKSTLIKMITKEENPDSGKIIVGGIDLDFVRRRHIPHYRRRLGVVFQDYKLLPTRTVFENVAFALEIAGLSNREIQHTVPKVLDLVGLLDKANRFPGNLSGGERQRVSIARSVARQPKILIADEPTGNLDKLTRQEIIDLLQRINDFGTTLLVTTHDENIVNNLSKRVVTLKGGRIVGDQKINGIYRLDRDEPAPTPQIILRPVAVTPTPRSTSEPRPTTPSASTRPVSASSAARATVAPTSSSQPSSKTTATKPATSTRSAKPTATPSKSIPSTTPSKPAPSAASNKPAQPSKPTSRDAANQWYAASRPLKAAPKLSNFLPGQTVKLRPAPSLKQAVQSKSHAKPKTKRVI